MGNITATIGLNESQAEEIIESVKKGERVTIEIKPDVNPEAAQKEVKNLERQLERIT